MNSTGRVAGERVTAQRSEKVPFRLVDWSSSDTPMRADQQCSFFSTTRFAEPGVLGEIVKEISFLGMSMIT